METTIHNRSRNRKQERRQNDTQSNNSNNNNNKNNKEKRKRQTPSHKELTNSLIEICNTRQLIESPTGTQKRQRVLNDLDNMLIAWSESLMPGSPNYDSCLISPMRDKSAATTLLSFGSYRLGVHTPEADVDCLVLAPPHLSREDFFSSWLNVLKENARVTELHPIPTAYTPVIKFEMDDVKIDLIFARVTNSKWLSEQRSKVATQKRPDQREEMSLDDGVLIGLEEVDVRSANGVRVAQFLLDSLNGKEQVDNFRVMLRVIKEWARVHGLYANVLGFLGGVNWAILCCWICKRNPDAQPSKLLHLFFTTFAKWSWPVPVYLSRDNQHPPKGVTPLPTFEPNKRHLLPIITPCYPPMNSSYNVGQSQLRRLRDELGRASQLTNDILSGNKDLNILFESKFFEQHANYLQLNITANTENEFRIWFGLCESKMRLLILGLDTDTVQAYPFARFFHQKCKDQYIASFFIGLRFAPVVKRVDISSLVTNYLQTVNSFAERTEGMDLTMNLVTKNDLPYYVFEDDKALAEDESSESGVDEDDGNITDDADNSAIKSPLKRQRIK